MSDIIFKEKKNIAILTLNREKTLNAWNSKMRKQICNIFSKINSFPRNQINKPPNERKGAKGITSRSFKKPVDNPTKQ